MTRREQIMAMAEFNRKAATAEAIGEYHRTDRNHENDVTFFIKGAMWASAQGSPLIQALAECVGALVEMREGNGFVGEYTGAQADKADEALDNLDELLKKEAR